MAKGFKIGEYFLGSNPRHSTPMDDLILSILSNADRDEQQVEISKITNIRDYRQGHLSPYELSSHLRNGVMNGTSILLAFKDNTYTSFDMLTKDKLDDESVTTIANGLLHFMLHGEVSKLTFIDFATSTVELDSLLKNNTQDFFGENFDLGDVLNLNSLTEIPHHDKELMIFERRELLGKKSTLMLFAHAIEKGERIRCSALIHKEQLESAEIALHYGFELHIHTYNNSFWVRDISELPSLNKKELYYIDAVKEVGNSTLPFNIISQLTKYAKEQATHMESFINNLFADVEDNQITNQQIKSTVPTEDINNIFKQLL